MKKTFKIYGATHQGLGVGEVGVGVEAPEVCEGFGAPQAVGGNAQLLEEDALYVGARHWGRIYLLNKLL